MPASWTKDGVQSAVTTDASQNTTITGDLTVSGTFAPTTLTVDTDTLHVDSVNNRVGVGTTSPDSTLHVDGNTRVTALTIGGTTSTAQITLYQSGTTDDGQDGVVLGPVRSGHTSSNSHSLFLQSAWSSGGDTINRWNVWSLRALQPGDNDSGATLDFINEANATANQPDADATNAETVLSLTKSGGFTLKDTSASSSSAGPSIRLSVDDGAVMASGHRLGVIEFAGAEDASSTITVGARIEAVTDNTWSASENGANLNFYTTDGNASQSQHMTILAAGNVGMGVADPAAKLEVFSTTEQLRLSYDSDSFASFTVADSSNLTIATGESGVITISDTTTFSSGSAAIEGDTSSLTLHATGSGDKDSSILFKNETANKWVIKNEGADNRLSVYDYSDTSEASHIDPGDNDWQAGSDSRIKKDVANIDSTLSLINNLRPVTWKRKYGKLDRTYPGLIAQEVKLHFPLVVGGTEDSFKEITLDDGSVTSTGGLSIGYSNFVPYLIKAIQELSAKVTALESA